MRGPKTGVGIAVVLALCGTVRADNKPAENKIAGDAAKPQAAEAFPILMPQETEEQTLAKIRALASRYRLPGDSAGERRRAANLQESLASVCSDFEAAYPKHADLDWVRATHMEAYYQLSYLIEPGGAAMLGMAQRIAQQAGKESGLERRHPLELLQQMRQQILQYGRTLGSIGNFRDSNITKRNQIVANLLRYSDKHPKMPGVGGLLLEFGRMFHEAEMPAQAGNLLKRVLKNYAGSWEAEEAAKLMEQVTRATTPVDLKFTDAAGKEFDLAAHRGHVTIVFFWSPEATGNKNLAARVNALLERYGASDGLAAVGIARGDEAAWKSALESLSAGWPQYLDHADDGKSAAAHLAVVRTPMFVLFDHNGMLKQTTDGANLEAEVYHLVTVQQSLKK